MKLRNQGTRKIRRNSNKVSVFSLSDYDSNDGMLTSIWGSPMWFFLHCMSFNYPINPTEDDKINYLNFVKSLTKTLPCGKCRSNLINNFKKLPLTMKNMLNRETFSKYIFNLHEVINTMLSKKSGLSYEEVRETYENFRARCQKNVVEYKATKKNEIGCVVPFNGEKTKCVLTVVPQSKQCKSFTIE
jgi:hypothetical protein